VRVWAFVIAVVLSLLGAFGTAAYLYGRQVGEARADRLVASARAKAKAEAIRLRLEAEERLEDERAAWQREASRAAQKASEAVTRAERESSRWQKRYRDALREPYCARWAAEAVRCPVP